MGTDLMFGALRWVFWGILYLAISLAAMVLFLGYLVPHLPGWMRWAMFGVFLYGIALDARQKAQRKPRDTPPSGGHLASSHPGG